MKYIIRSTKEMFEANENSTKPSQTSVLLTSKTHWLAYIDLRMTARMTNI